MNFEDYQYYRDQNEEQGPEDNQITKKKGGGHNTSQSAIQEASLSETISQFKYASRIEGKANKTLQQYDYVLTKLEDFLSEDRSISSVSPTEIRNFLETLINKDLSKATVAIHFRVVQAFFNWLVDEGLLENTPTRNIDEPKTPKKYPRILTKEQTNQLIQAAEQNKGSWAGYRNYTIVLTFLDTGLRLSELINARLVDLNFNERSLKVLGKGAKDRVTFFGKETYKALRKWTRRRPEMGQPQADTVFISQNGDKLKKRHVQRTITRLQERAGLEDTKVSPHVLRHTAATMAVKNGMGTFALKRFFGWESVKTAMKYVHMGDQSVKEAFQESSPIDGLNKEH